METLVDAETLAGRTDDPDVRVVDVRDAWEYEGIGHLPGAVSVPFETFRDESDAAPGTLPTAADWAETVGAAGIGQADHVVAYDDTNGVFAARFLVTALLYGHAFDRLALLDGDYSSWSREHETETAAVDPELTEYEAALLPAEESPLVGYETVRARVADGETLVLDTREPAEYAAGHLPGAVQIDWRDLLDEQRRGVRSRSAAEAVLAERGVTLERPLLLYCNTARRISHTYLVLRHLGHDAVEFYEGSLTEWRRRGGPVET